MSKTAAEAFRQFHRALHSDSEIEAGALHFLARRMGESLSNMGPKEFLRMPTRLAVRTVMSAANNLGVERARINDTDTSTAYERIRTNVLHALERLTTPINRHVLLAKTGDLWSAVAICPETPLASHASAVARLEKHLEKVSEGEGASRRIRLKDGSQVSASETRIVDEKTALEMLWLTAEREDASACISRLQQQVEDLQSRTAATEFWEELEDSMDELPTEYARLKMGGVDA